MYWTTAMAPWHGDYRLSLRRVVYLLNTLCTIASATGTTAYSSNKFTFTRPTTMAASTIETSFSSLLTPSLESSFTVPLSLPSNTSVITSSKPAHTYTVHVGNGDHKFTPDVIQAAVGDIVEFNFYPVNHSVIRAEYQHSCIPYEMTGRNKIGFWSGFFAVDAVLDDPPKYNIRVNDTNPVFYYCSAPDSCTKQGMVGVINPNASTSLQTQRKLALQASYQLSPGEPFPSEAETSSSSTLPDGTTPQQTTSSSHGGGKLGAGAIAGIAIACVSIVLLGALLAFFWGHLKGLKDEVRRKHSTLVRSTEPRNTWFLTHSPSLRAWPGPQTQPSPPYTENNSPMIIHAVPPAYYESEYGSSSASPQSVGLGLNIHRIARVSRAASNRSMGGTFEFSPMTGNYTRTHDSPSSNSDLSKYSLPTHTSDMTSPVDPDLIQFSELQRVVRTPELREGYIDEKGKLVGRHVNKEDPAEMTDTSVQGGRLF